MKILKVLFVAIIALGMVACNNDQDVPEISGEKDASISIKVFPSSKSAGVRAVGSLDGNGIATTGLEAERKIFKLEAWIFVNDNLEKYSSATSVAGDLTEIKDIAVTSGLRKVVVTANTNIGSKTTLAALEAADPYTLSQDITAGMVMTAEPFVVDLKAGDNYYGYTKPTTSTDNYINESPVALTRVNARVAIVDAKLALPGSEVLFDALTDVQVAMFNVPSKSKLFGTSLAINENFLFGEAWPSTLGSYVDAPLASSNGDLKEVISLAANDGGFAWPITSASAPYFYVTENNASVANGKMLIVLRGKPTLGTTPVAVLAPGLYTDTAGYTYYPVWVNAPDHTYTAPTGHVANNIIVRNTQYNIYLTIKGIGNPTIDKTETAYLDVMVEVAEWTVVNQNVTW